jgi:hypothetical protein
MLAPLILGCGAMIVSMLIQVIVVVIMIRCLIGRINSDKSKTGGYGFDATVISVVLLILFAGNLVQVAIWAGLFIYLGEFTDFLTAFYHSMVNFSSLGYGDMVMSEKWRLLGSLEASTGVLMFGLTSGTVFAVMVRLFSRRQAADTLLKGSE